MDISKLDRFVGLDVRVCASVPGSTDFVEFTSVVGFVMLESVRSYPTKYINLIIIRLNPACINLKVITDKLNSKTNSYVFELNIKSTLCLNST